MSSRRLTLVSFMGLLVLLLAACSTPSTPSLSLGVGTLTLTVGDSVTVTPTVTPGETIVWSTSPEGIVDIRESEDSMTVTAVAAGSTVITARLADDPDVQATVNVTVREASEEPTPITFEPGVPALLGTGGSVDLAAFLPASIREGALAGAVWSTSDPSVATVDANGVVTATGTGTVRITVVGAGFTAEVTFVVSTLSGASLTTNGQPIDQGTVMALREDGSVLLAGTFNGTMVVPTPDPTFLENEGFSFRALRPAKPRSSRDVFVTMMAPDGSWSWATSIGGADDDVVTAIEPTVDGGAIVTGWFKSGSLSFDTGPIPTVLENRGNEDAFVARIDANGSWVWANRVGDVYEEVIHDVAVLPNGNAVVVGSFASPMLRFDAPFASDPVLENRGGPSMGPIMSPQLGGPSTSLDVFVAMISADGAWQWALSAGGVDDDEAFGVTALTNGGAIVAGQYGRLGGILIGSVPPSTTSGPELDPHAFVGPDGLFFGTPRVPALPHAGSGDTFVAMVSPTGAWAWAARASGDDEDGAVAVAAHPDGGAYVTGTFKSSALRFDTPAFASDPVLASGGLGDVFAAYVDGEGAWQWARKAGGAGGEGVEALTVQRDGTAALVGWSDTQSMTFDGYWHPQQRLDAFQGSGGFAARIDRSGTWTWAKPLDDVNEQTATDVVALRDGSLYVSGMFEGPTFTLQDPWYERLELEVSNDFWAAYLVKLDADGSWSGLSRLE